MKIDFSIPASSVENTRQLLQMDAKGHAVDIYTICYADVVITATNGVDTLTLNNVPFLFLMEDMKFFLELSSSESCVNFQSTDTDQQYQLNLVKRTIY